MSNTWTEVPTATTQTWLDVVDAQTSIWKPAIARVQITFNMTAGLAIDPLFYDIKGFAVDSTYYVNTGSTTPTPVELGSLKITAIYDQLYDVVGDFCISGFTSSTVDRTILESISIPALGKTYAGNYSSFIYPYPFGHDPDNPTAKTALWEFYNDFLPVFGFVEGVTYEVVVTLNIPPDFFSSWTPVVT